MFQLQDITRENIKRLIPYSSARSEFTEPADIFIDANENPFDSGYNRYPDPLQKKLKEALGNIKNVPASNIFLGNGSDEIIDLLMRCICEPGVDNIITFKPSYTMYITSAQINDIAIRTIDLNADFSIDINKVKEVADNNSKILFICSPNNPIGNITPHHLIAECCRFFKGIVVVDEAYIDFSTQPSAVELLKKLPNLLVLQTLSKAYGMAGLRLGMGIASEEIVALLNKIKPPYNISGLSQDKVLENLINRSEFEQQRKTLITERKQLYAVLKKMPIFSNVYPSEANFILTTSSQFKEIFDYLVKNKVIARLRDIPPLIAGGVRFTVGTPEENTRVIALLEAYINKQSK